MVNVLVGKPGKGKSRFHSLADARNVVIMDDVDSPTEVNDYMSLYKTFNSKKPDYNLQDIAKLKMNCGMDIHPGHKFTLFDPDKNDAVTQHAKKIFLDYCREVD